jgi:hypothetical protein
MEFAYRVNNQNLSVKFVDIVGNLCPCRRYPSLCVLNIKASFPSTIYFNYINPRMMFRFQVPRKAQRQAATLSPIGIKRFVFVMESRCSGIQ